MEYLEDKGIILEDPFSLRPGTNVTVSVNLQKLQEHNGWDSSIQLVLDIPGAVYASSIKSDTFINPAGISIDHTIDEDTGFITNTHIVLSPIDEGTVDLDIYYLYDDSAVLVTRSAITSSQDSIDNYEYIEIINNIVIPKTLIDINGVFDGDIKQINILNDVEFRGKCEINGDMFLINSDGKLGAEVNVFRRGLENVWVSAAYKGYHLKEANNKKLIRVDNQELQISNLEFFGMECVGNVVFIMTSNGLYGFDKWCDFDHPIIRNSSLESFRGEWNSGASYSKGETVMKDNKLYRYINTLISSTILTNTSYWEEQQDVNIFCWTYILGTDLAYISDDSLAVVNGDKIEKYFIRHDKVLFDRNDNRVWFREPNPDFEVS